jgi:uncharacterized protein involved in outer membrane biogenesis
MKALFKWLVRIAVTAFLLVVLLVVLAVLLKDVIAKSIAERNLRDNTGMDAKISKLEVNLGTPTVNLEGLKLYNRPEFGGSTFLDLPELRIEYVPADIREGKLHFKTVRLNLAEVHVVKNKDGKTNIDMLQKESKKKTSGQKSKTDKPGVDFGGIDTLYLTVGKIRITDELDPRNNAVIDVGIKDEVGTNLKDEAAITQWFNGVLIRLALREAMTSSRTGTDRWQKVLRVFGVKL